MSDETIPVGWTRCTIDDLGEVRLGRQRSPKDHSGSRMRPYLRVANVFDDRIDLADVMEMNFTEEEERVFLLEAGDILLNEGQSSHLVGRSAMYRGESGRFCFTNSLIRFRAGEGIEDAFALQLFRHMMFSGKFEEVAQITTNIAHLGKDRFAKLEVSLAPLPEQRRIVAKLDDLRARSRRARQALDGVSALLDQLKQSILAAAFRGDLTADWRAAHPDAEPASVLLDRIRTERQRRWEEANPRKAYVEPEAVDAEGLPELPEGWAWARLEELTPVDAPIVYGIIQAGPHVPGGVPYVRPADISDNAVDLDTLLRTTPEIAESYQRAALAVGDVVYSIVGTIGKWIVADDRLLGANITQSSVRIRPAAPLTPMFFVRVLACSVVQQQVRRNLFGNAVQRLNVDHVRKLVVPVAPPSEWLEIERATEVALAAVRRMAHVTHRAVGDLDSLDQSILARAFRGELVPQDPSDEPAAALLARLRAAAPPVRKRDTRNT